MCFQLYMRCRILRNSVFLICQVSMPNIQAKFWIVLLHQKQHWIPEKNKNKISALDFKEVFQKCRKDPQRALGEKINMLNFH